MTSTLLFSLNSVYCTKNARQCELADCDDELVKSLLDDQVPIARQIKGGVQHCLQVKPAVLLAILVICFNILCRNDHSSKLDTMVEDDESDGVVEDVESDGMVEDSESDGMVKTERYACQCLVAEEGRSCD